MRDNGGKRTETITSRLGVQDGKSRNGRHPLRRTIHTYSNWHGSQPFDWSTLRNQSHSPQTPPPAPAPDAPVMPRPSHHRRRPSAHTRHIQLLTTCPRSPSSQPTNERGGYVSYIHNLCSSRAIICSVFPEHAHELFPLYISFDHSMLTDLFYRTLGTF
jgi:hypothetical protein